MKLKIYRNWRRQWRWKILAGNNKVIAASAEGYHNYADCIHNLHLNRKAFNEISIPA